MSPPPLLFFLAVHAAAATQLFQAALRGSANPKQDEVVHVVPQGLHITQTDKVTSKMKATMRHNESHIQNGTLEMGQTKVPGFAYSMCNINPNSCQVNANQVAADLGSRVVLFFGCSIDINAVKYFCNAAGAPVVDFTHSHGQAFGTGNLLYCSIGGTTLAYSFQPGVSGPPYFEGCDEILKRDCKKVQSAQLIQESVNKIVRRLGRPPTAVVVDSSLWDVASWWTQDGKPPEPYVAPPRWPHRWCQQDFPALLRAVQMASPSSKIAFRTAPRVEISTGYGQSTQNIDAMNACLAASSHGILAAYTMIDYHYIVEAIFSAANVPDATVYDDSLHPGVIPSVLYIDLVLQWIKGLPIGR